MAKAAKPKVAVDPAVWVARSAIQKAIRRGDLNLTKTAFDLLWHCPDRSHRQWLKWRLTILVAEEAIHYTGELARFWAEAKKIEKDTIEEENHFRGFLYKLTIISKSKDGDGIIIVSERTPEPTHPELVKCKEIVARIRGGEAPDAIADELKEEYNELKLTPYEYSALGVLKARSRMGGMLGDRILCCTSMVLIAHRRLPETIKEVCEKQIQDYLEGAPKPRTVDIPWYCYDMHTRAGKIALSAFMKRKASKYSGLTEASFSSIWFMMESGHVPLDLYPTPQDKKSLQIWENYWWTEAIKLSLPFGKLTASKVAKLWSTSMREEIQKMVEWAVSLESSPKKAADPNQPNLFD